MKEKLKSAGIRALWTFVQTAVGIISVKAATNGDVAESFWEALAAALAAAALSFVKSMGVGMPETDDPFEIDTDGELEVTIPPNADTTPYVTAGVRWNPNFSLKDRVEETDPVITLSVKRNFEASKDLHRQIRL